MPKIVRFYEIGEPEVLKIEEVPLENPGPGEVRLRVEAFGLNRSEVQYRRGVYRLLSPTFPSRLGKEAAGVIDALGPDVEGFQRRHDLRPHCRARPGGIDQCCCQGRGHLPLWSIIAEADTISFDHGHEKRLAATWLHPLGDPSLALRMTL